MEINKKSKTEIDELNSKLTNTLKQLEVERKEFEQQKAQLVKARNDSQNE